MPRNTMLRWICGLALLVAGAALLPALLIPKLWSIRATPPVRRPIIQAATEPADVPAQKLLKDKSLDPYFIQMRESFVKRGQAGEIGLLFIGDSITGGWQRSGVDVWTKYYSPFHPAIFAIGGERTQYLLWGIEHGELDNINPKIVVLLVGTNNIDYPAEDIVRADVKIVQEIHDKLPRTKLLLLGIFPREYSPSDPVRVKIKKVNTELAKLDDGKQTRFLDIGNRFLTPTDALNSELMPDYLHPNAKGYQVWAEAMQPLLDEMMK